MSFLGRLTMATLFAGILFGIYLWDPDHGKVGLLVLAAMIPLMLLISIKK